MKIPIKYTGSASIPGTKNKYVAYIYENDEKNEIVLQLLCNSKALRENKDELPKLIGRISKLEVKLANGESLLLLSCNFFNHTSRISYGDEIFKYYVDYIIENLNLKQKDKFCDAEYNVTGILKWGSAYKFRISDVSNHYIDLVEDQKILIFKNEEYKIEYQVSSNYPIFFDEEDIELKQIPQFIIKSTKGKHSIYWFESIFNQMKIILELSTHQKINYQKMQLLKVDEEKYDPEKDILYGVHSKFSNANQNSDIRASTCLFNCRQLIESADLEAWNDKSKKLEPIINLYTEAYDSPSTSIQNLFLNVCQALETYHARMVTNNRDEYLKKSNQKIARMNPSFKDFLIRNKRNTKSILLSERISDLMVVDNIPKINFSGGFKYFDFPQIVSNTRNYYTHYDENRQKNALFGEKLVDATELLRLILEYHLLRELGFNDDFATNNMRDSFGQINIHMGYFENHLNQ